MNSLYKRYLFLFLICFCSTTCVKAQNSQQLLYFFDYEDTGLSRYLKSNDIKKVLFIDEHAFGTGDEYGFDEYKLRKSIESLYPDPLAIGFCYIDLEAPYIDDLINESPDTDKFKKSLSYYLKILRAAKSIRPNIKWGYYGIPFTTYWDLRKEDWFVKNQQKLAPLIKESDVLFPSMYFFYSDDEPNGFQNNTFVNKNIKELIKLSTTYDKPLFPFIMERFHPSNQTLGLQKIPEKQFLKYVKVLLNETWNQKQVDGIVWWNADKFFYNNKTTKNIGHSGNLNRFLRVNSQSNLKLIKKIQSLLK